jgi:ParB family chromosome partitioning protein
MKYKTTTESGVGRQVLGRGLGALIPRGSETENRDFFQCPIHRIRHNKDQPRKYFDEQALVELAQSIERSGIVQPLVVRQDGADYRLIAGERRLRAAARVGLTVVPVVIKDVSPAEAFELALVENIQRQDLNPVEEAAAFDRLMRDRNYTQEQLASTLGKSRSSVANTLRLLNLDTPVREKVASGALSAGAARALLALPTAEARSKVADIAASQGLNVRQLESLSRRVRAGEPLSAALDAELTGQRPVPPRATKPRIDRKTWAVSEDEHIRRKTLADGLRTHLNAPVAIHSRGDGGTIEIRFGDAAHLDAVLERLRG